MGFTKWLRMKSKILLKIFTGTPHLCFLEMVSANKFLYPFKHDFLTVKYIIEYYWLYFKLYCLGSTILSTHLDILQNKLFKASVPFNFPKGWYFFIVSEIIAMLWKIHLPAINDLSAANKIDYLCWIFDSSVVPYLSPSWKKRL